MTYDEFWSRYLRAHSRPSTRLVHYAGTLLAWVFLIIGVVTADWRWLAAAPVIGYGFAWTAHGTMEGNRPETFGHPFWSIVSDFRMLLLWLSGRLGPHLSRAGVVDGAVL